MKYFPVLILSLFILSCGNSTKNVEDFKPIEKEAVEVIRFSEFESMLNPTDDAVYIINFFASWCVPCVKELPYFEQINAEYKTKGVKVVLISLDFKEDLEKRLKPVLEKMKIASIVKLLDETDYNSWVPKVDGAWDGAIPYTLVIHKNKMKRYYGSITADTLIEYITPYL